LAPSVLYLFEKDLASTWYANVDAHYLARISRETTLYPIAGLGLSVWKFGNSGLLNPENFLHEYGGGDWGDNSGGYGYKDTTKIGLNLGVGCETRLTEDILVGGEFKYNITNERLFDQAMITIRAAYYF
jgi:opacity protein-like surface antigen